MATQANRIKQKLLSKGAVTILHNPKELSHYYTILKMKKSKTAIKAPVILALLVAAATLVVDLIASAGRYILLMQTSVARTPRNDLTRFYYILKVFNLSPLSFFN